MGYIYINTANVVDEKSLNSIAHRINETFTIVDKVNVIQNMGHNGDNRMVDELMAGTPVPEENKDRTVAEEEKTVNLYLLKT